MNHEDWLECKRAGHNTKHPYKLDDPKVRSSFLEGIIKFRSTEAAAFYAGISPSAYKSYARKHPEFRDKVKQWKKYRKIKAEHNVFEAIESGDLQTSKWLLERTEEGYNPKSKQEHSGGIGMTLLEQIIDDTPIEDEEEIN